jgi:hypothetical protein
MAKQSTESAAQSAQSWHDKVQGLQQAARGWYFYQDVGGAGQKQDGGAGSNGEAQDAQQVAQAMESVQSAASRAATSARELGGATKAALDIDTSGAYRAAEGFDAITSAVNRAIAALRAYAATPQDGAVPAAPNTGGAQYRAGGGRIFPGSPRGTDTVPLWATPGEHVMSTRAVDYWGADLLDKMNRAPLYRADGGIIGDVASKIGTGGGAGPGPVIRVELADGLVASQIASPAGRRAQLDNLSKDATAARQRLGIG